MDMDQLTYCVNGLAMEVHRETGPGLDEIVYHERLSDRLADAGIEHRYKPREQLIHRGGAADEFEADIVVPGCLCVECKALRGDFAPVHLSQIISYLKFWRVRVGLLLNFGRQSLLHKRVIFDEPERRRITADDLMQPAPPEIREQGLAWTIAQAISRLHTAYGLGFRATTYRGLIVAELGADGVTCSRDVRVQVPCRAGIREVTLDCLLVDGCCPLMTLALQDQVTAADRAIVQTYLRCLHVPWGAAVNFGKREVQVVYVHRSGACQPCDRP